MTLYSQRLLLLPSTSDSGSSLGSELEAGRNGDLLFARYCTIDAFQKATDSSCWESCFVQAEVALFSVEIEKLDLEFDGFKFYTE